MIASPPSRTTLTVKPVTHTHFTALSAWEAAASSRGYSVEVRDEVSIAPFPISVALSPMGRIVGACFNTGIEFGWLRDL